MIILPQEMEIILTRYCVACGCGISVQAQGSKNQTVVLRTIGRTTLTGRITLSQQRSRITHDAKPTAAVDMNSYIYMIRTLRKVITCTVYVSLPDSSAVHHPEDHILGYSGLAIEVSATI